MKLQTALAVLCLALFSLPSHAASIDNTINNDTSGHQWTIQVEALITKNVADVPIPAALWLFVPALAGLLSIRRRK